MNQENKDATETEFRLFKEMVLLYEDLVRKETVAYVAANPKCINAYEAALENIAPKKSFETMKIIYGQDKAEAFKMEYNSRKQSLIETKE